MLDATRKHIELYRLLQSCDTQRKPQIRPRCDTVSSEAWLELGRGNPQLDKRDRHVHNGLFQVEHGHAKFLGYLHPGDQRSQKFRAEYQQFSISSAELAYTNAALADDPLKAYSADVDEVLHWACLAGVDLILWKSSLQNICDKFMVHCFLQCHQVAALQQHT